jgi:epoxyqueuosine reductase QueG
MGSKAREALEGQKLKDHIVKFCREHGADIVGFAPVERWDEAGEVPPDFRPRSIWPPARTVIVLGLEMPLPVVETTPSVLHMELYRTTNRQLDDLAVALTRRLNRLGHASFFFTRDGFGSMRSLREKNLAAFSHVMAAKYAGLGTIGVSHCLLTPEFGPRVRFVSVFTEALIPPDPMMEKDLCIKCELCALCCPKKALTMKKDRVIGDYDKTACLEMAEELVKRRCYPCGICTKVCPIGKDRLLYKQKGLRKKYLGEAQALAADPGDRQYKSWSHIRRYGVSEEGTKKKPATKKDKTGSK